MQFSANMTFSFMGTFFICETHPHPPMNTTYAMCVCEHCLWSCPRLRYISFNRKSATCVCRTPGDTQNMLIPSFRSARCYYGERCIYIERARAMASWWHSAPAALGQNFRRHGPRNSTNNPSINCPQNGIEVSRQKSMRILCENNTLEPSLWTRNGHLHKACYTPWAWRREPA